MHGLRLFSDVSARGNAAPSLLHGYASHTETDHAASRLLPLILHPDEKSGTTHNCSKIHEGNADNNSYFHDADIVSYEAQPDASQYPEYMLTSHKNPTLAQLCLKFREENTFQTA